MLFNTLAASFIWGINTVPARRRAQRHGRVHRQRPVHRGHGAAPGATGAVADTCRRASYLLGSVTPAVSTASYWLAWQMEAPFWAWAVTLALLGLGFTFFSGATEAWLVDALKFTGFKGNLESVFKGQIVSGAGYAVGVGGRRAGRAVDQPGRPLHPAGPGAGRPFAAFLYMWIGGRPDRQAPGAGDAPGAAVLGALWPGQPAELLDDAGRAVHLGVGIYAFYAMQPYLLEPTATSRPTASPAWPRPSSPGHRSPGHARPPGPAAGPPPHHRPDRRPAGRGRAAGAADDLLLGGGRAAGAVGPRRGHPAHPDGP